MPRGSSVRPWRAPSGSRFVFERAQVLAVAGHEDEAYNALRGYLDQAKGDSLVYRNAAYLGFSRRVG